jgi:hypothetical protein
MNKAFLSKIKKKSTQPLVIDSVKDAPATSIQDLKATNATNDNVFKLTEHKNSGSWLDSKDFNPQSVSAFDPSSIKEFKPTDFTPGPQPPQPNFTYNQPHQGYQPQGTYYPQQQPFNYAPP